MTVALSSALPEPQVGDAELIERARAGEDYAFNLLFRRHAQFVAAVALRLTRSRADTDDIVQETFAVAFARLGQLERPEALRGWLARIALSFVHRKLRFQSFLGLFRTPTQERLKLEEMASAEASPLVRAELAQLDQRLSALSLQLRTPWVLKNVLGCTLDEVAEACACSRATVKRRVAEANEKIGMGHEEEVGE
jgi:RNA polymerase sigma-70 factor (ECF subfamily)